MSEIGQEIGSRIQFARKMARMNQTELANAIHKTLRTVQKYESGEIEPSLSMIAEIAKALNTTPGELLGAWASDVRIYSLADVLDLLIEMRSKNNAPFDIKVETDYQSLDCSAQITVKYELGDDGLNFSLGHLFQEFEETWRKFQNREISFEDVLSWAALQKEKLSNIKFVDRRHDRFQTLGIRYGM